MITGYQALQTKILTAMTAQIGANKDFVHGKPLRGSELEKIISAS